MTDPGREPGDLAAGGRVDENEIRADERAKVEAELRSASDPDAIDDRVRQDQVDTGEVPITSVDESAIRADERARVERDLQSMPVVDPDDRARPESCRQRDRHRGAGQHRTRARGDRGQRRPAAQPR